MNRTQKAWLSVHPDRSFKWLKERIADGFEIHHCDRNHSNDDPDNLILIDKIDHKRLHGKRGIVQYGRPLNNPMAGKQAYTLKAFGLSWRDIAVQLGAGNTSFYQLIAKEYAEAFSKKWPLGGPRKGSTKGMRYRNSHPVYRGY